MTLLSWIRFSPTKRSHLHASSAFTPASVSVVIPVKDNQVGVDRLLQAISDLPAASQPQEVIVVDNGSKVPLVLPYTPARSPEIRLISCDRPGPACARNDGARHARGEWLLFIDSDCVPSATFVSGYSSAINGSVAYAGYVRSDGSDRLSRYYESQDILIPPRVEEDRPQYLITANTLVWRQAFQSLGGFDEAFPFAGGEDVDLGFRLSEIGLLSYAPESVVHHRFEDGYIGFVRRFYRYGRGNRRLARCHGISLVPKPFIPATRAPFNLVAALAQFLCLSSGYWVERIREHSGSPARAKSVSGPHS